MRRAAEVRGTESCSGLPVYGRLVYRTVWPGIDVVDEGSATQLKDSFSSQEKTMPRCSGDNWIWPSDGGKRPDAHE